MNRPLACLIMFLTLAAPVSMTAPAATEGAVSLPAAQQAPTQGSQPAVAAPRPGSATAAAPASPSVSPAMPPRISLGSDISVWSMASSSDGVVKAVMSLLVLASVVTWTILTVKIVELRKARRALGQDLRTLGNAASLLSLGPVHSEVAHSMLEAIRAELARGGDLRHSAHSEGLKERVSLRLSSLEAAWARRMMLGANVVASIGATAPFVGLFGTVWGIMNSFMGIVRAHATNLAVVAPGIAEALLTTAIGLAVAVPAVLIYNGFTRWLSGYRALLADATHAVACLVSLEVERAQAVPSAPERQVASPREREALHGV